ncbi:acyltransferase [Ramlibacter sp. H39-3-26]|uniref:acyltransferase n=1 Tax=Curvibacter soli TaxID=3031331 RepID=UPI0023DC3433|nr:acyltransferase [Ramlibacter sp. H39-3-26]MDF1485018.1 acyltransferase [Ramlibacter sp. H39-3-26]
MLRFLPPAVRGAIALLLLVANTLFWCALLFPPALLKLALPPDGCGHVDPLLNALAARWVRCNGAWMRLMQPTVWDMQGLRPGCWYLVNCNHQSWADIFVLQRALDGHIPLLKFFLKQQLLYVPVIGLVWWALDFPFMKRHSRAALRRNPMLRDEDRATTRRACAKFARVPTSVMNFAEGTRFTPAKHAAQASPYRHLLKPKAGALALAFGVLGSRFEALVDATIVYPAGAPTFWQFLCGRVPRIVLRVRALPIDAALCGGDYEGDQAFRTRFHRWLAQIWEDKDQQIDALVRGGEDALHPA